MKLPSSWQANAAVCALAFIKLMAVRQSSLATKCDAMKFTDCPTVFIRRETRYTSVLVLRPQLIVHADEKLTTF
jgi:hypothetical protein